VSVLLKDLFSLESCRSGERFVLDCHSVEAVLQLAPLREVALPFAPVEPCKDATGKEDAAEEDGPGSGNERRPEQSHEDDEDSEWEEGAKKHIETPQKTIEAFI
jgi:hypothetical protein